MTTELDAPIISIPATPRPIEWVDLVGIRYPVRRPKSVVESGPKGAVLLLAAYIDQDSADGQNRAARRAATKGGKPERIELTAEQIADGMTAVWLYLANALADPDDYAAIRRRVYGPDLSDVDANAHTWMPVTIDPNPDDDIDTNNVITLVGNLIGHWSPEREAVKSSVKTPPAPAKKQSSGGTTTKRPVKRR